MTYPKISIITPSFNQGQFLEQTILSVIGQNYPNLEYLILDGGSTDNSVEIIKKYEKHLAHWSSEKDGGQADAINKGFKMATGDIIAWINSDDYYLPATFFHIQSKINIEKAQFVFGNCIHIQENNPGNVRGSDLSTRQKVDDFLNGSIIQPSTFWTKKALQSNGFLSDKYNYAFDLEWFNKAKMNGLEFIYTEKHLAVYRFHSSHKTSGGGEKRLKEIAEIYSKSRGTTIYLSAMQDLLSQINKLAKLNLIINKSNFLKKHKSGIYRLFFSSLNKLERKDLIIFVTRVIKGL